MKSRGAITLIVLLLPAAFAMMVRGQNRPYDHIMKEIGPLYANLKKNLDSGAFAAAAEEAGRLENLFKETEDFWVPFKTKDALDFARSAQASARSAADAARSKNAQKAQAAYTAMGKACKGCHDSHRETMPDKTFRIKP